MSGDRVTMTMTFKVKYEEGVSAVYRWARALTVKSLYYLFFFFSFQSCEYFCNRRSVVQDCFVLRGSLSAA